MATKEIDWNIIELTEIYESFDVALGLLDEDFERARRVIQAAIKYGATAESMTAPIEDFATELHAYCERIKLREEIENKKIKTPDNTQH